MVKELPTTMLAMPPERRRVRRPRLAPIIPRRSSHLAKKVMNRPTAMAVAQNVLLMKLGLADGSQVLTIEQAK
jgi:hypothetical protein